MKIKIYKSGAACLLLFALITGCTKNETHFYDDAQAPGLGIFSNTGNNIFSCYIDGKIWRTEARKSSPALTGGYSVEVRIQRQDLDSVTHVLSINWYGNYLGESYSGETISLYLSVPQTFSFADFTAMKGKRLTIDGVNSYFQIADFNNNIIKGSGTIFFYNAQLDSIGVSPSYDVNGMMSGILEADFGSFKLTSGRFDHNLDRRELPFW